MGLSIYPSSESVCISFDTFHGPIQKSEIEFFLPKCCKNLPHSCCSSSPTSSPPSPKPLYHS